MKDNNISLEEFWGVITSLTNDAKICLRMLEEPPEGEDELRPFWRRMFARAVFAVLDGATYRMMFHAYAARERPDVTFSLDELMRLEKYYDFDEDKEPEMTLSKARLLDDIRFAFNVFARVHYSDYILPINDPEWIHLKEIAHVRVCLQYPRSEEGLEVYEENVDDMTQGLTWFLQRIADLLEDCRKHAEEKLASWDSDGDEVVM